MSRLPTRILLMLLGGLALLSLALWGGAPPAAAEVPTRPPPLPLPTLIPGAIIELHLGPQWANVWTVMQWQGAGDIWHDTDGWRGTPDATGVVRWYVGPEHLGQGPFRWQVYEREGGRLLDTSEPFPLPDRPRATLIVALDLAQP